MEMTLSRTNFGIPQKGKRRLWEDLLVDARGQDRLRDVRTWKHCEHEFINEVCVRYNCEKPRSRGASQQGRRHLGKSAGIGCVIANRVNNTEKQITLRGTNLKYMKWKNEPVRKVRNV